MALNPIGIAVPFFFLLMALEYWRLRKLGSEYRLNDTATDISCGLGDQMLAVFFKGFLVMPYALCEKHWGIIEFRSDSVATWVIGFFAVDFFYYWYHRFCHRVNLGWITHAVHHQSEEFNLAVALRQPWFGKIYSWVFYIPLAIVGIPVEVMATSFALNLLYQFWIHTELIDRMGAFEWVFNSPSHHRVHHGTNPEYVDKNYAGVLIIWDRMFGTFAEEEEKPVYGTLKPLRSWNPFIANFGPWIDLFKRSRDAKSLKNAWLVWWKPPEWTEDGILDPSDAFMGSGRGYDLDTDPSTHRSILFEGVVAGVILGVLLTFQSSIAFAIHAWGAALIFLSVLIWGGRFEGRHWVPKANTMRIAVLGLGVLLVSINGWPSV